MHYLLQRPDQRIPTRPIPNQSPSKTKNRAGLAFAIRRKVQRRTIGPGPEQLSDDIVQLRPPRSGVILGRFVRPRQSVPTSSSVWVDDVRPGLPYDGQRTAASAAVFSGGCVSFLAASDSVLRPGFDGRADYQ